MGGRNLVLTLRLQTLRAVKIKSSLFFDVTPFSLVEFIDVLQGYASSSSALKTAMVDFRNSSKFVLELTSTFQQTVHSNSLDSCCRLSLLLHFIVMLTTVI